MKNPGMEAGNREIPLVFGDETGKRAVRRLAHEGRWFFSILDVLSLATSAPNPAAAWDDLKRRLADEGHQAVLDRCRRLRMPSADGKRQLTDAADTETLLRILQAAPSPRAEAFREWLAQVGAERLVEADNPSLAVERARRDYLRKGYSADWIEKRLHSIAVRGQLTGEWRGRGVSEGPEFSKLTRLLHEGTFAMPMEEHRAIKGIAPRQNLRDSMTPLELLLTSLAEETAKTIYQARNSHDISDLERDTREAAEVSRAARREIEQRTGQPVVTARRPMLSAPAGTRTQGRRAA